ncbi:MAG: aminotransferase class IV [archaeon]|jgi:branched-subunit amino acid aminotransferase/4-amino-4-deoxychorismate lyase
MAYAIFNGKIINENEAVLGLDDKAFFFDFAVYSSLKVIQGKIFFSEYHVDRLLESAKLINLGHSFSKEDILKMLNRVIEKNRLNDAFLRVVLVGDADKNKVAKIFVLPLTGVHYYPNKFYSKGVKVITYNGERRFPTAKTMDLLLSFLAMRKAEEENAIEALLVDHEGNVREGTRSNFFAIKGDTLITPPKDKILEGITKKIIFDLCKDKFEIVEEDISLSNLKNYEEFFITSTLFNVLPINRIDDVVVDSSFPKTKLIQKKFKEYYSKEVLGK